MNKLELMKEVDKAFEGRIQLYSRSENRIEGDVSTELPKEVWARRLEGIGLIDNDKHIPNSWKYNDITLVLFGGAVNSFIAKSKVNNEVQ